MCGLSGVVMQGGDWNFLSDVWGLGRTGGGSGLLGFVCLDDFVWCRADMAGDLGCFVEAV